MRQIDLGNLQQPRRGLAVAELLERPRGAIVYLPDLRGAGESEEGLVLGRDVAVAGACGLAHQGDGAHAPELQLVPVAELQVGQARVGDELEAQVHALALAVLPRQGPVDQVPREVGLGVHVPLPPLDDDVDGLPRAVVRPQRGVHLALLQQVVPLVLQPHALDETLLRRRGLDGLQGAQLGGDLWLGSRVARHGEVAQALDVAEG